MVGMSCLPTPHPTPLPAPHNCYYSAEWVVINVYSINGLMNVQKCALPLSKLFCAWKGVGVRGNLMMLIGSQVVLNC